MSVPKSPARVVTRALKLGARFLRDRRGTYAVEFGFVALPFFALLCAIAEVSWVSFNAEQLQAAVDAAARQIRTGQAQTSNYPTAASFVSGLLCPAGGRIMPAMWDCSKLVVDVRPSASFGAADMSNSFYRGTTQYCLGSPSTIVVLRVVYPMSAIFPLSLYNPYVGLANDVPNNAGWFHILMGSAAFKTESYSAGAPSC